MPIQSTSGERLLIFERSVFISVRSQGKSQYQSNGTLGLPIPRRDFLVEGRRNVLSQVAKYQGLGMKDSKVEARREIDRS